MHYYAWSSLRIVVISLRVIVTGILHEAMKGTSPTRGSHSAEKVAVMGN